MPKQMSKPADKRPRGRPRERDYRDGDRVPLSLRVTPELKNWLDRTSATSGRSQSQEVEFRLEQTKHSQHLFTLLYGANAALIETIADAADTARRLGESLAAGEGSDHDDFRIYSGILDTLRTTIAWHDPASGEKVVNPQHINGGALSWETLPMHAAWIALNRASMDSKRLAAFKAIDAKFQKRKKERV